MNASLSSENLHLLPRRERREYLKQKTLDELFSLKTDYLSEIKATRKDEEVKESQLLGSGASTATALWVAFEVFESLANSKFSSDKMSIEKHLPEVKHFIKQTPPKPRYSKATIAGMAVAAAVVAMGGYWGIKKYQQSQNKDPIARMEDTVKALDKEIKQRMKHPETNITAQTVQSDGPLADKQVAVQRG